MAADDLPALLLSAARGLVDSIDAGVRARGFTDVRPAHGFAFTLISGGGATVVELARHLDVTKQAASQMVEELISKGYVDRRPHPADARARLIVLTERGWACTRAADEAAAEILASWSTLIGDRRLTALRADLAKLAVPGRLRPTW
ncbi:MarR family transcriptional regulator [Actinoplanes sp. NBRC 103695]|uniref:MarR family winged helix-turn-helix transcriptional regulator n=1 Tax=Actinoplanes sp. NBRC 103695 TaxID=3032202 RepID=UPI0024A04371|nr:MarR family transcriptional regulator [Actinoplanes sp. NBRC 103695]GLY95836.1 MarR family transcriptional regulator [Actinoplanes sp. NBRC 103695]